MPVEGRPCPPGATLRVLLVEDHKDSRDVMSRMLRSAGFAVDAAATCGEALALGTSHTFDLLVTDLDLPDGSGWDLAERLRPALPGMVAIAVTGHGMPQHVKRSEQ